MTDDADLLRRYVEFRSEADFTELVGRYLNLVYQAALRRTGGRADLAEDITQSVFTVLADKAAGLIEHKVLAGWLYTTTKHAANSLLRAERRRLVREQEALVIGGAGPSEPSPQWEEIRRELDGVMDQLPQRDREAVLLRFFHGQAFAQIGAAFGLSEEAARKRVDRALDRLRERLLKRGVTSTAAALGVLLSGQAALAAPAGLTQSVASVALAHAAGTSLPAMGALQIMSTKTTLSIAGILGIAGILSIPAVGIAVYELHDARVTKASITAAQQDYDSQAAKLSQLQQNARDAEQRVSDLQVNLDKAKSSAASPSRTADKAPAPANKAETAAHSDGQKFIAAFGQAHALLMELGRAQIAANLAGFYRSAGLTPAQIASFEIQTGEFWLENLAVTPNSVRPGVSDLPEKKIREIIGDDGYDRFQEFNRLRPAYSLAGQVGLAIGLTATPLSNEQSDQLVQAIVSNSTTVQGARSLELNSVDWNAVQARAQATLTPAQLKAAQPIFLSAQFQQAVNLAQKETAATPAKPKS